MPLRKILNSNHGVVGIVVAVLLIGLLVTIVSIVQLYYVPAWMEEREAEHIEQVLTQFSDLKFGIDTQISNNQSNIPIATSITLGSKELPFLMSMRAFGALEILSDRFTITITDESEVPTSFKLGIIKYTSANAYHIPDEKQSFVYEAGAILTSQTSGASISIKPAFKPIQTGGELVKIILNVVNISGEAEKISWGGYDTIGIQTELNHSNELPPFKNVSSITIKTSFPKAWETFINSTLKKEGLVPGPESYEIILDNDALTIEFLSSNNPDVEIKYSEIFSQIGPGWIE
jgi:hypothetical protein